MTLNLDYQKIFVQLNREGIDYLVAGGLAVNFYGIPRMTYDIDLMVSLDPSNILKLVSKIKNWGYRPRVPVVPEDLADECKRNVWIQEKGMKAFSFYNDKEAIGEIDLIIDSPIPYERLKAESTSITIAGEKVPVVSIQDLIELKRRAARKQDIADAENLEKILNRK